MGFHDVLFPTNLSAGSGFGPGFNTSIIVLASGAEQRISRWAAPKRRFNAQYSIRKPSDLYAVLEFYIARLGPANTFRMKDWSDYSTTPTGTTHNPTDSIVQNDDVLLGAGTGGQVDFQLLKVYTSGAQSANRTIVLPTTGTVLIAVNAVSQTEGVDFTVNYTTGLVTFATAPTLGNTVEAGFEFEVPTRFGEEIDLQMAIELGEFDIGSIPSIPMVEVRDEIADPEMAWHGGAAPETTPSINYSVTLAQGRMHKVTPTANMQIILPSVAFIEAGGPIFAFYNASATFTVELMYSDAVSSVEVIPVLTFREVWLELGGGDLKAWRTK